MEEGIETGEQPVGHPRGCRRERFDAGNAERAEVGVLPPVHGDARIAIREARLDVGNAIRELDRDGCGQAPQAFGDARVPLPTIHADTRAGMDEVDEVRGEPGAEQVRLRRVGVLQDIMQPRGRNQALLIATGIEEHLHDGFEVDEVRVLSIPLAVMGCEREVPCG